MYTKFLIHSGYLMVAAITAFCLRLSVGGTLLVDVSYFVSWLYEGWGTDLIVVFQNDHVLLKIRDLYFDLSSLCFLKWKGKAQTQSAP